jgi:transposase
MDDSKAALDALLQRGAQRLTGHQRRLFLAEVTIELCGGNARQAEQRFGWGRATIGKGMHELRQGMRCLENFTARRRPRWEDRDAQRAADMRELVEPHTQVDPELKSSRRYSNGSAAEVLEALQTRKGYAADDLPSVRTMRDILNRMGYRLKRIQKGKPLQKTAQTDAIFDNVKAVREEMQHAPATLEIAMDTKAKVNEGDYARGGKNPDGVGRECGQGLRS